MKKIVARGGDANITWEMYEDGTIIINGAGKTQNLQLHAQLKTDAEEGPVIVIKDWCEDHQ